jgi:hypothetical protein
VKPISPQSTVHSASASLFAATLAASPGHVRYRTCPPRISAQTFSPLPPNPQRLFSPALPYIN